MSASVFLSVGRRVSHVTHLQRIWLIFGCTSQSPWERHATQSRPVHTLKLIINDFGVITIILPEI